MEIINYGLILIIFRQRNEMNDHREMDRITNGNLFKAYVGTTIRMVEQSI